jgi:hypothetical protein
MVGGEFTGVTVMAMGAEADSWPSLTVRVTAALP